MAKDKIYKQVIIFGPDHNGGFASKIAMVPKDDGCLIIGDGKRDVTLEEIEEVLSGKINEATRIDFCAHGGSEPNDPIGTHRIWLSDDTKTYTSTLFKSLNKINGGKPVYTHLWSCYAGNADKEFSYLPEGSLAVLHSSKNSLSFQVKVKKEGTPFDYDEYDGTAAGAGKNLLANLHEVMVIGGTLKFNKSGKEYAIKYVLPEVVEANKGYLDFIYEYYHQKGEEDLVLATQDVEEDFNKMINKIKEMLNIDLNDISLSELEKNEIKATRDMLVIRVLSERGNYFLLKSYIERMDGYTLLGRVVSDQRPVEVIETFLRAGANPNMTNDQGLTPLFYARDKKTAELLIAYGADVGQKNGRGYSLLESAVSDKRPAEVIETFLKAGANPNLTQNEHGLTSIFYAQDKKTAELLIAYGADVGRKNGRGYSLLECVVRDQRPVEVIETFLQAGANPFILGSDYTTIYAMMQTSSDLVRIVENTIEQQENPLEYLIQNHENKASLFKTIMQIKENNPELYEKIGPLKITQHLKEITFSKKNIVSNFRKLIKDGDLSCLNFALTFEPVVIASDIEMAKRIFGEKLPEDTLRKMQELSEKHAVQPSREPSYPHILQTMLAKLKIR